MGKAVNYVEAGIQRQIAGWLNGHLAEPATFTAIGHGGRGRGSEPGTEGWTRGAAWKQMGVKAGWPDLHIAYAGCGWWLEVKSLTGVLSTAQRQVHGALRAAGHHVAVVRSFDQAKAQVAEWGIPLNAEKPSTRAIKAAVRLAISHRAVSAASKA